MKLSAGLAKMQMSAKPEKNPECLNIHSLIAPKIDTQVKAGWHSSSNYAK